MSDNSFEIDPLSTTDAGAPDVEAQDDSFPMVDSPGVAVAPAHDPKDLATRAAKYDLALGDKSPGQDQLIARMQSNLEDSDRQRLALEKTISLSNTRNAMVKGLADNAAAENRPFSQAEQDAAMSMSSLAITDIQTRNSIDDAAANVPGTLVQDPYTIYEREYANKVINNALTTGEDTPFNNAFSADPEGVHTKMDVFADALTFKESYQKLAEQIDAQVKQQSYAGFAADFMKGFIPGYSYFKSKNLLGNTPGMGLFGSNMLDNVHDAYVGKPEQKIPLVAIALAKLAEDNPQLAQQVAHSLVDYPSSIRLLDNIFVTAGDLGGLAAPAAKAIAKGLPKLSDLALTGMKSVANASPTAVAQVTTDAIKSAPARFSKVLSDISSTVMKKNVTIPEVLDSAGQVQVSAAMSVVDKIQEQYSKVAAASTGARDLINELPGIFNALEVTGGVRSTWATKLTSETLQDLLQDGAAGLKALFLDPLKTDKYGQAALDAATLAAQSTFKIERRDLENAIMNVFHNNPAEGLGEHLAVMHIGDPEAVPFATKEIADNMSILYGLSDTGARSVPVGNEWAIQIQRPMDFTLDTVRDGMKVDAKNNPTPWANVLGRVLTGIRSTDDVMNSAIVEKLKRATYGSSGLERLINQSAKRIGKLRGDSIKNFQGFIKSEMMERNPLAPEKLGGMSKDPNEFEIKWASKFNRLPTDGEKNAYFTFRFINDMHYAGLNLGLFLDKNALGLQNLNVGIDGLRVEGKITTLADYAKIEGNAHIMVLEDGIDPWSSWKKQEGFARNTTDGTGPTHAERIAQMVNEEGYILTRISDVGDTQLRAVLPKDQVPPGRVTHILTKTVKGEPLSLRQINYQPGIHNIMPDGWYISQPKMGLRRAESTYYGDTNIFFAGNQKIAKDYASKMEQFRQLYVKARGISKKNNPLEKAAAIVAAKDFAKTNLPVSFRQLQRDFGPKGPLELEHPILARASNQSLDDAHKLADHYPNTQFIKHSESDLNMYRGHVNLEFATKRGDPIREIVMKGDPSAPVYGMRQADLMDPSAALDRGVSAMVRGRYFEPLKQEIANNFVSEFGDLIDPSNKALMADPFRAIRDFESSLKPNLQGEDLERLRQARAFAARANQFFGTVNNQETKFYKYLGMKLIGGEDPNAMSAWRQSLAEILSEGHPADMLKKLAFYPKMGFYNVKQLLQQGNTYLNVLALSPKHGGKAGLYSLWMRAALLDDKLVPEIARKIDAHGMSKTLGMSGDEFTRVVEDLKRTGFGKMGHEVATREQHMEGRVIQTKLGAMLDDSLFFMKEGEEFVRRSAWTAAYLEKEADLGTHILRDGTRRLSDQDLQGVLNRADFYNVNMSHASNAAWQQGFASVPTQFWSYQIRMMEQLMGKRMTWQERAQLLGTYSAVYGIPIGLTAAMPIWPVHESVKEYLIGNNIDTDSNLISKVLDHGILENIGEMVGLGPTNVQSVYGPSGIPLLKDISDGKKGIIDSVFGASGNVLFNTVGAVSPALMWIGQSIMGEERVPLKAQDFADVLTNISTLSTMEKMYIAATTQKYLTKYGQTVGTGDSATRMLFLNILGIQPQAIDDMYRTMQVNDDYGKYIQKINRWVQDDVRSALSATTDSEREVYFRRASIKAKWYPHETDKWKGFSSVLTESKDLIERARQQHARQSTEAAEFEMQRKQRDSGVQ